MAKGDDWQTLLYPQITSAIQGVAQQIVNCPFSGISKRMYLQAKVQELIALQVDPILKDIGVQPPPQLKKVTIAQIHHAKEILLSHLEKPPTLTQLATQVGVSERTLQRGFRKLFGTTVFGYLTKKRMEQAEQFLREGRLTVAEVANARWLLPFRTLCRCLQATVWH